MLDIKSFFLEINKDEKHKKITNNKKIYFFGGLIFIIAIFLTNINLSFKLLSLSIYFVGLLSDKKYLFSPNLRLFLQSIIVFSSIYLLEIRIFETRIEILDNLLNNEFISVIFTAFCLLILMNGSNFIDGINCNLILYYLAVSFILLLFNNINEHSLINKIDILIIIISLLIALVLNFLGKITSGDGGAYLISFFLGINLIYFSSKSSLISPFFIVLLLWYPAFENFFSILRKLKIQKSALEADFKHLHQLLFLFINRSLKSKLLSNNISGIIINSYNIIIFLISIKFYHHTQTMIMLVLFNIIFYLFAYFKLLVALKK